MSTNSLHFAGNLAGDPELRFTPTGRQVAQLTVIENRRRQVEGEWVDATPNSHRVQVWGREAEHVTESLTKGQRVVVVGRLVTDTYADKETGETRYSTYVVADEVGASLKFHTVVATKAPQPGAGAPGIPGADVPPTSADA